MEVEMSSAIAAVHLNMVQRFPRAFSWVPRRRRRQVAHNIDAGPDTVVMAKSEPSFYAWVGQNVAPKDRSRFAYLASEDELVDFRGRVLVLPGAWNRKDAATLVQAIEPRVQCGQLSWSA